MNFAICSISTFVCVCSLHLDTHLHSRFCQIDITCASEYPLLVGWSDETCIVIVRYRFLFKMIILYRTNCRVRAILVTPVQRLHHRSGQRSRSKQLEDKGFRCIGKTLDGTPPWRSTAGDANYQCGWLTQAIKLRRGFRHVMDERRIGEDLGSAPCLGLSMGYRRDERFLSLDGGLLHRAWYSNSSRWRRM